MNIAIAFDTPYPFASHDEQLAQMETEYANWEHGGPEPEMEYQIAWALRECGHDIFFLAIHEDPSQAIARLADRTVDMVFNAVEAISGVGQLDYLLPALLESHGLPYTGAPPVGLMVTRNKAMSKKILAHHGIGVPDFVSYRVGESVGANDRLEFPVIVKPLQQDGSVGIAKASVVHDLDGMAQRVGYVHDRFGEAAIAEQFLDGRELYVTVIGNGDDLQILPAVELVFDRKCKKPEDRIATRKAKWDDPYRERKGIRTVYARPLSAAVKVRIEQTCRATYRALWLRDYARLDLRVGVDDQVWVLEANANPYVSEGHEVANSALKAGIQYNDLIDRIVREAIGRGTPTCH